MILSFDNGKAFIPKCGYKKSDGSIILCQDCSIKVIEIENKIKGFQEGEKLAIKIIDEEINYLDENEEPEKIEELKKQREHLEWESKLE